MDHVPGEVVRPEDQDEVPECRICRCEGDEERPLFYPCACTGSIKWCHESCLVEWIKVSRTREYCETCGTQLVFKPVYSESTPAILPISELVWLGLKRVGKEVPYALRASFVGFIWLVFVPVWAASAFHYLRPSDELLDEPVASWQEWLSSRPAPISFLTWEIGVWILLAGFFSLFMLVSVFDFVRGFEMGEYATELEALRQRAQQQGAPLVPEDDNGNNVGNQLGQPLRQDPRNGQNEEEVEGMNPEGDLDLFEEDDRDGLDQLDEEEVNAENNNGNVNNNNNMRNDLLDEAAGDQLGFDEWVGLRGPWCLIMNNVMCLCFCILMFLVTFYVVPESLGRGVYREASKTLKPVQDLITETVPTSLRSGLSSAAVMAVSTSLSPTNEGKIISLLSSTVLSSSSIANSGALFSGNYSSPLKTCSYRIPYSLAAMKSNSGSRPFLVPNNVCEIDQISRSVRRLEQFKFETACVVLGLIVTMAFIQLQFYACAWSWKTFMSRALRPTSPLRGMPHFVWKSVLRSTRTVVRVQKVVCLLIFKMIAFPIVLGVLIDRALSPVVNISDEDRILFVADHPHLTALTLWVTGITHTLLVTMNVILVRDILHQEVLDGIIRMRDPHGNQFLPLLVEPIVRQTKRTLVTCLIYTMIVFLFISLPCRIADALGLLPLPLTARFVVTGIQLPVELALFHMWMLHVLEKSKATLVQAQTIFFRTWCSWLGLTQFLLPIPNNQSEYARAVQQAQMQAGQLHWLDSAPRVPSTLLQPRRRVSHVWPRMIALAIVSWMTWLLCAFMCVTLPFLVGLAAVSCLPTVPGWVKTDVRLYFLGWIILRAVKIYAPRLLVHTSRLTQFASRDLRNSLGFSFAAISLGWALPTLAGLLVFLETAFSETDFPAEDYASATALKMFAMFMGQMMDKLPLGRAWLAGFPFVLLFSIKTGMGRTFWRYVFDWRLMRAGKIALKVVLAGIGGIVVGLFLGLEFWNRAGLTSSPLYTVKTSVLLVLAGTLVPGYVRKYYDSARAACQRFHDTLKDEKYLMGRRLRNYDARV